MKRMNLFKNFYKRAALGFVCFSMIILVISYLLANNSMETAPLYEVVIPTFYPEILVVIWIGIFIMYFMIVFKTEKGRLLWKITTVLLCFFLLFCMTIVGILLMISIQQNYNFFDVLRHFMDSIQLVNASIFGIITLLLNIVSIIFMIFILKAFTMKKRSKNIILATIISSIMFIGLMIVIQVIGYNFVEYLIWAFFMHEMYMSQYFVLYVF